MATKPLGRFEHNLVRFVAENPGVGSKTICQGYGEKAGYGRGTIVKSLNRLVSKGRIVREPNETGWGYRSVATPEQLDAELVRHFVVDRLENRLGPIANFLREEVGIPPEEIEQLERALSDVGDDR